MWLNNIRHHLMISSFQPDLSPKTVLVLVPVHSLTHYTSYITVSHIHTCIQHYIYSICYVTVTKCSGTLRRSSPYIFRSKPKNQNYDYRNRATRNGSQNIKIEEINIEDKECRKKWRDKSWIWPHLMEMNPTILWRCPRAQIQTESKLKLIYFS